MKIKQWNKYILELIEDKDPEKINLLSKMLSDADQAKQELRNKGYGWTGLSLLDTVREEVPTK